MKPPRVDSFLRELESEGAAYLEKDTQYVDDSSEIELEVWKAAVAEALAFRLPPESPLLRSFHDLWSNQLGDSEVRARDRVVQTLSIMGKARSMGWVYESVSVPKAAGGEFSSAVEREVRLLIGDILPKTPWFYLPLLALVAAVGFALYGSFQIRDLRVDVRAMADSASQRAQEEIDAVATQAQMSIRDAETRAEGILRDAREAAGQRLDSLLQEHASTEQARITASATQRITDLQNEPILDSLSGRAARLGGTVASLAEDVDSAEVRLSRLSEDAALLRRAVDSLLSPEERGHLNDLLNRVRVPTWLPVALISSLGIMLVMIGTLGFRVFQMGRALRAQR